MLLRHFDQISQLLGLEDAAAAGGPEALLSYLNDTQRRVLSHITTVNVYSVESYMLMETATRRNLELTQTLRDGEYRGSLLWLLDGTVTAMGGRLLRQWVLQPRLDRQEIIQRLDAVEELVRDTPMRTRLREQLAGIHDLERLVGRITYESANPRDLAALGKSLEKIPGLNQILADAQEARLQELARGLEPPEPGTQKSLEIRRLPLCGRGSIRPGYPGTDRCGRHPRERRIAPSSAERKNRD